LPARQCIAPRFATYPLGRGQWWRLGRERREARRWSIVLTSQLLSGLRPWPCKKWTSGIRSSNTLRRLRSLARGDLISIAMQRCRQQACIARSRNRRGLCPGRMWNGPPRPRRFSRHPALTKQRLEAANPPLAPKQRRELLSQPVGYRLRHRRLLLLPRPRLSRGGQPLRLRIGPKRVSLATRRNRRAAAAILKHSRHPEVPSAVGGALWNSLKRGVPTRTLIIPRLIIRRRRLARPLRANRVKHRRLRTSHGKHRLHHPRSREIRRVQNPGKVSSDL